MLIAKIKQKIQTYNEDGTAVFEMIIILPVFFILALVIINTTTAINTQLLINQITSQAAQIAVSHQSIQNATTQTDSFIRSGLAGHDINCAIPNNSNYQGMVTITYNAAGGAPLPQGSATAPIGGQVTVTLTCETKLEFIPGWPGGIIFQAHATQPIGNYRTSTPQ